MRFLSRVTFIRTFYTFSNVTFLARNFASASSQRVPLPSPLSLAGRGGGSGIVLRSMPGLSLFGSLFGSTAAKRDMASYMASYPVQKSEDEWQAVLNKGNHFFSLIFPSASPHLYLFNKPPPSPLLLTSHFLQNNSASSANKAPKPPTREPTTNTCPPQASTPAPAVPRPFTAQPTNLSQDADGPPTLIVSPGR